MLFLWIFLAMSFGMVLGWAVNARLRPQRYNGVMRVIETPKGLTYSLELVGDPELLAFQDVVAFKVIPPNYQELIAE